MSRTSEAALYPRVAKWLGRYLEGGYPRARVRTYDTHRTDLSSFIRRQGLQRHLPDFAAYEIQVDVTGVVETRESVILAFVECKMAPITLRDLGQLLGYSLVAKPGFAFLLSPRGLSERLATLLLAFGRQDLLVYAKGRAIRLAVWDVTRNEVDLSTLVPRGTYR